MKRQEEWKDYLFILLAFAVMGALYYSTSMGYEDQNVQPLLSNLLSGEPFRNMLEPIRFVYADSIISIDTQGYAGFIEFFIRKGAHFGSYFLIGLFWFLGLKNKMKPTLLAAFIALFLSFGYASFDELRQSFHPTRTALIEDVILDTVGAITGIGLIWLVGRPKRKRRKYNFLK